MPVQTRACLRRNACICVSLRAFAHVCMCFARVVQEFTRVCVSVYMYTLELCESLLRVRFRVHESASERVHLCAVVCVCRHLQTRVRACVVGVHVCAQACVCVFPRVHNKAWL